MLLEQFAIKQNAFCRKFTKSNWKSLQEAQQGCEDNPNCAMFQDRCGKGTTFDWCYASTAISVSHCGSILYDRFSKYLKLIKVHRLHTV